MHNFRFAPNSPAGAMVCFNISIVDDGDIEPPQTFVVELSSPTNGFLDDPATANVNIFDTNLGKFVMRFIDNSFSKLIA